MLRRLEAELVLRFTNCASRRAILLRLWARLLDGTLKNTFELHTDQVNALVALPDNQHALSGSADSTVKLFNVDNGAVLRSFTHQFPVDPRGQVHGAQHYPTRGVNCLALLPDGRRFVSGSDDKTARIAYHGLAPIKA